MDPYSVYIVYCVQLKYSAVLFFTKKKAVYMKGTFYLHSKVTYYRECATCHVILSPEYFNTVTKYLNITTFT